MDIRTAELIMLCKDKHNLSKKLSKREVIAKYMSDRCLCPISEYDERTINNTIVTAALDYLDSMKDSRPSSFIREIMRQQDIASYMNKNISWYDAILDGFRAVPVRRDGKYINGFTEENTALVVIKEIEE